MQDLIAQARAQQRTSLDEHAGKKLLAAFGVTVPQTVTVKTTGEVDAALATLKPPLVVKIMSPDILHKSDAGGVNIGLTAAADVKDAINAMAGGQIVSKADFDQHLIQQRIANSGHEGVIEDDFYRNTPQVSDLTHFYDFDSGIQADVLEHTMGTFLPGRIARFTADAETAPQPGVRNARLLDFAELAQQHAQGCLVVRADHVVALRKLSDPETGQPAWLLIDSARDTARQITPAEYLHEIMDQGHCEVLSWSRAHPNPSDSRLH